MILFNHIHISLKFGSVGFGDYGLCSPTAVKSHGERVKTNCQSWSKNRSRGSCGYPWQRTLETLNIVATQTRAAVVVVKTMTNQKARLKKTPAIDVDSVRPSDPPRRGSFTKSKRKIKAQQKRDRKRDNLAHKCKNSVQPSNTPLNNETDHTMDNSNCLTDDLLHDERSLTDMLASALRDTPSGSQTVRVADNGTPQSCIDESALSQVISLECQLVVSRIENESASNEITRLKTVIELLEVEISCYKKTSTSQKQEIKSLKSTNDNLRREPSHFRGMRRFATRSAETRDKNPDINEQPNVTKAKLARFQDEVTNVASLVLKLLEDEQLSTDDINDTTPFQLVRSRSHHKSAAVSIPVPNSTAADRPVDPQVSRGRPIPVIVRGAQGSEEVTSSRTYSHILSSAPPPQAGSRVVQKSHGNRDTFVIGTSLTRGAGAQLAQQGIQATCFTYAGCEIPDIRGRLRKIVPKTHKPGHVILQCGGNDAEKRPAERVIGQYESLINEVRRLSRCQYICEPHSTAQKQQYHS